MVDRRYALFAAVLLTGVQACADKKPTALTVAISSEVPVPETVNRVQIRVEYDGAQKFDQTYDFEVSGGGTKIPGTLTVEREDTGATGPVRVTVTAIDRNTMGSSVVRRAVVGFSEEKTKLLRMPLRFSCLDFPLTCGDDQTCRAGECVSANVETEGLPDYDESQVFGKAGDGKCFDRAACVPKESIIDLTALVRATKDAGCEVSLEAIGGVAAAAASAPKAQGLPGARVQAVTAERVNFGVVWKRNASQKWTAVDQDAEEGWQFTDASKTRVKLAPGLCKAIRGQTPGVEVTKVIANSACPPKLPTQPECPVP